MTGNDGVLRVAELFAGVGGFHLGLRKSGFRIVWSNQWEPSTKAQHASNVYVARFGNASHSNEDISKVDVKDIPEHDLLVGGFPCQDYSVARSLSQSHGIIGKKGVLWWQIYRIINEKKPKPQYLMFENVDRLLISPANQRSRDFAIILSCLSDLGYVVEWRVINAADYGFPQRRRRIFISAYHKSTDIYRKIRELKEGQKSSTWLFCDGVIAKTFPVIYDEELFPREIFLDGELSDITNRFNRDQAMHNPFANTGLMIDRCAVTIRTRPNYNGNRKVLKDVLIPEAEVPEEYYIDKKDTPTWRYLKGAKHILKRSKKTGRTFKYDEGSMVFPDDLDQPSRTIVTGEGGSSPSRFKHVIQTSGGRLRRLTPVELEKLNGFPPGHTEGVSPSRRAFFMGNALVVGIVEKLGKSLLETITAETHITPRELQSSV